MKKLFAILALAMTLGSIYSRPSEAVMCQALGASACLSLLDDAVNKQSFVEAWVNNVYQQYSTRNCPGGPSNTGTYIFYGRSINEQEQLVDNLKPNISCNECDARSRISGLVDDGYLGECSPTNDTSWDFTSQFCGLYSHISLYQAAYDFLWCIQNRGAIVGVTVNACNSSGVCLK